LLQQILRSQQDMTQEMKELKVSQQSMAQDIQELKVEQSSMKQDIQELKAEQSSIKQDIQELKIEQFSMKQDITSIQSHIKDISFIKHAVIEINDDVKHLRQEFKETDSITTQNCREIMYLKATK